MRVIAMFRVSTERQANEGASLDAQKRQYRQLAKAGGWTTIAEFRGCESATQAASDRRVLQQVLECVRQNEPDAIYVHEQSRLTRADELEVALLLRELTERNLKVIVGGEVRDLTSIDGRFMVGIQSLVDRAEAQRIRERSLRGKRERARQGKWNCGKAPFGYRNPVRGESGRGTLVIQPEEAELVRQMFERAAAGESSRRIARCLTQQSARSPRGRGWGSSSIKKILKNPAYVGTHASGVWVTPKGRRSFRFDPLNERAILVDNAHPAIVSRELWNAVRRRAKPPCSSRPNMLTGLLHVDGLKYSSDRHSGTKFYCPPDGTPRGHPWLPAESADEAAWNAFVSLATKPELIEELAVAAKQHHRADQTKQQITRTEAVIEKLRRRLNRLIEMRADGEIGRDVFAEKSEETRRQIADHETCLCALRENLSAASGVTATLIVKAVQALATGSAKLTPGQRRSALSAIVRRVDIKAVPTGTRQPRGPSGAYRGRGGPRWRPSAVTFHLTAAGTRSGHSDTTC